MRHHPAKAYPYPVLRPDNDDYPTSEFQVETLIDRDENSTASVVQTTFELSDSYLRRLVESSAAEYVLLIISEGAHYREGFNSPDAQIKKRFDEGRLSGTTEVAGFLVATRAIPDFSSSTWHPDYADRAFELAPGSVLAMDETNTYELDRAEEKPLQSIFLHTSDIKQPPGLWQATYDSPRIHVRMAVDDFEQFKAGQSSRQQGPLLLNGVYLPALLEALVYADKHYEDVQQYGWYRAINHQLANRRLTELGNTGVERVTDAQQLLEHPFAGLIKNIEKATVE